MHWRVGNRENVQVWNEPPKIEGFVWRALRDILPTNTNLVRRCMSMDTSCSRCGQMEDITHVLWRCPFVAGFGERNNLMWQKVRESKKIFFNKPFWFVDDWLKVRTDGNNGGRVKKILQSLSFILGSQERDGIWGAKEIDVAASTRIKTVVFQQAIMFVDDWLKVKTDGNNGGRVNQIRQDLSFIPGSQGG
ncbi:hypothetical protein ACFE04_023999 [Oxalis oulophora]